MQRFFDTVTDAELVQQGQLHAYLVPRDTAPAEPFLPVADRFAYLSAQPPAALHLTVVRVALAAGDRLTRALPALAAASEITALAPVTGTWGAPETLNRSLLSRCELPGWGQLVSAAEASVARIIGSDVLRYAPPFAPHVTLAYGTADGPDAPVLAAAAEVAARQAPLAGQPIRCDELLWCLVTQHPDAGIYTFDTLATTPLQG